MEEITLNSQSVKTTIIDNIIFTAKSGNVEVTVDTENKIATISGGNVDISENFFQAIAGYTFKIDGAATINGIDYEGSGNVKFGESHWDVTVDKNFSVGNGSQSLGGLNLTATGNISFKLHTSDGTDSVTINGIKCSTKSDGAVSVTNGTINISGSVNASNALKASKINTTAGGEINLLLAENDDLTFDGLKCEVTEPAVISIKTGNVTSTSGAFRIKTPNSTSLTLNGVNYTSTGDSSVSIDEGDANLTGTFKVTLGSEPFKLNKINVKGSAGAEFNFDSDGKNFVNNSDNAIELSASYGKTFKVNGVSITADGESTTASVTKNLTTLSGNSTVGDGETSLSNKNFSVSSGEIVFKTLATDKIKINDATFSGATNLTANFANSDAVKVEGTGVKIDGAGNFIIASTDGATINGTAFKSSTAYAGIAYNADDGYTLQTPFTIGDGTKNLNGLKISNGSIIKGSTFLLGTNDSFVVSEVTYSGDGEIYVDDEDSTKINLTGKISVDNSLNGKTYAVDDKADATFNFDADDIVTINGKVYQAAANDATVTVKNGAAVMNGSFSAVSGAIQTYEFKQSSSVTDSQGVKYTATSTNAKITVDEENKKVKVSSGSVAITLTDEEATVKDYSFSIAQNSTAQINGVDFTQTGTTSDETNGDAVFTDDDAVTLNSPFTLGNGTQKLNGLKVTLATTANTIFNLGDNDSVTIIKTGTSADETELNGGSQTIDGMTFNGTGTVNVNGDTISLNGNISVSGDAGNGYSFILQAGSTYTFGTTSIAVGGTGTVTVEGIGETLSGNLSSFNASAGTFTIDDTQFVTNDEVTFNLGVDGAVSSIEIDGSGNVTITENGNSITREISGSISKNNTIGWESAAFTVEAGATNEKHGNFTVTNSGTSPLAGNLTALNSMTLGDVTFAGTGTITVTDDNITVGDGVTGTFTNDKTLGGITYGGTVSGQITSAGVKVHNISFSGTGSVDFTDATNFTASGVNFTIANGMTVNGITYQGSDVSASAASDSLTIDGKTYSGTGTIASDGSVTGDVTITIGNGASITLNGISCTNGTGSNLEVTAITNGITVGGIDFTKDGTGSLNFTSATNFTASGVNFTIANGMTVNGITYQGSDVSASAASADSLTIDGVTYGGTGTIEQNGVVTGNVTGTITLNGTITAGGITFSGTGTGTVTSASVVINGVTYTGSGNVTVAENEISLLDSSVNASFTLNGNDFKVNGIIFKNSGAATATSSNVVIGGITYSGSGTVNADGSVTYGVTGTFNLTNGNVTVDGITYVGTGAAEISSEGVTIDGVTYGGTGGNVTISGDIITVSGSSVDVTASSEKTVNGYTVNGGITVANGAITALKESAQVSKGSQVYKAQSDAAVTFDGDAKITVTSGTVNQTSGKFTFEGLEFTIASDDNATFTNGNLTSGGGTHTFANGETYTAYGKTYKPVDNNSKLQAVGDESAPYTTLNGTFEVTETVSTFEYDNYEYTATGDVTFRVTGDGFTKIDELTDKEVYNATGTRNDTTGIVYIVEASGNSYTITSGTYERKITNGVDGGEKLKSASNIEQDFKSFFKFGGVDYKGDAKLTLNVSDFVATETFTSGYGQDGDGNYIIKGTAQIDGANYTASDGDLVTVTVTNDGGITNVSGGTLTIETSSSIKINGIDYEGTGTLTVSGAGSVTVTDGSFTASGTFNNTSINGQSITIGGTNADEITLNVTPSAVTANSAGNGSFTINNEFFKVENDSEGGVTFAIQNGKVISISDINVDAQTNEPVKITIDDKVYKIRQTGKTLERDGDSWPEVSDNINAASYTVTFDGTNFTFTAIDGDSHEMTLDQDDFAFINGTALIIHETVTSAPITVVNESETPITVGNVAGIGNGTIHLAGTTADNFTVGEGPQTYKITGGTFSVAGENVSLVGNGNFTVNGAAITISDSNDLNTLIFDGATVTGINPANGTITVATGTFAISGTTITVTGNTNATMTFTPNDYAISGISNDATVKLADNIPSTLTINGIEVAGSIAQGEEIRFNSTSEVWTSGPAEAQSTDAYQIEIDDAGTIKLFYKATDGTFKQTKNISDYTKVFGDIKPDDDGGTLPTYSGGINIDSDVTDYVERITISKIGDYSVNNQAFTISSATTLKPLSESSIEISAPSNIVYDGMTISGGTAATLASDGVTLIDGATVTNTNSSATFDVTGTVTFDGITLTGADSTQVTNINKDATSITINNQVLNVTDDSSYTVNLTDEKISAVSNGAQIDGEFSNNKTISNDGAGMFTFYDQAFKAGGAVDFVTGNGNVTAVNNLNSTLEGDFTTSIEINSQAVQVTNDTEIGVKGDGNGLTELYKLSGGANVQSFGGATKLSTDSEGQFTFGEGTCSVDAAQIYFTSDGNNINGVKDIDDGKSVVLYQAVTDFDIDGDKITTSQNDVTLKVDGSHVTGVENLTGEIDGLTAGATVKVTGSSVQINQKALAVTGDDEVTVHATADGYEKVEGVDDGANFTTAENALIVTNGQGTFTFGSNSYVAEVNNNLTLKTGDSSQLVSVGGLASGNKFVVNQDEDGIYLGNNLITLSGAGTVSLTMGDNTVSGVENLTGEINGLTAGATVKVTGNDVTINEKSLAVTGDDEVTVHATGDGYGTIEGLTNGAQVTAENSTLVTDSEGTFTFQSNAYAVGGDSEVVFVTNENGELTKVESLTSGTVSGNFADGITVDGKSIQISSDDEVSVAVDENSDVKSIHAINSNAVVQSAANVSLVTAEDGTFTFNDGHQFDLTNNNSAVTLSTGNNSNVTAISGISSGSSVAVYAEETININGKAVTVKGVTSQLTFEMGSNDTISAVNELLDGNEVDGLSSGALVTVTGENTTINGAALTSNQAVTVYASSGGYGTVTGFSTNVNITAKNTSLVTDSQNGSFTFGGKDYEIADNEGDDNITLKTNADGYVAALDNLAEGAKLIISQANDFTLNGKHLEIGGATSEARATLTMGGGNTVSAVENLKGDINGLSQGALVTVTTGDNIKINGHNLKIDEGSETNYVVKVKSGGYSEVTGLSNGAQVTTEDNVYFVTNEEGTFTFSNGDYIITGDNEVTLKTDDRAQGILTTFDGLTGTLQTPSHYNTINGAAVYCDDTNISIVAVEGGISSIIGFTGGKLTMPSGTDVSIKSEDKTETINATINGNTYGLIGDDNGLEIHGNKIIGLNADARLTVGAAGTYTVNGSELTIDDTLDASLRVFVGEMINGEDAASARLYQEGDINFGSYTPAEEIAKEILKSDDISSAVIVDEDTDNKTVNLDNTKNLAVITVNDVSVDINGTSDSVVSSGERVNVYANDKSATIVPLGGTMNLTSAENSVIQLTNADIVAAIRDKAITFDYNGNVTVNLSNGAQVTYDSDYVNFKNTGGTEYKFAYLSDTEFNPGTDDSLLLYSDSSSERTITTGAGNDTAFVNGGDVVNLGAGSNYIEISTESTSSNEPAQIISTLESSASTTVKGFKANDLENGDIAKFKSVDNTTVTYSGSELTFTSGQSSLKMIDTANADFINVRIADESNVTLKTSIAQAGKAITVPATDDFEFASIYIGGDGSGVDLSNFEYTVSVDLNTNSGKFGESDVAFRDIHSIKGGTAEHTLIGAEGLADTLMAGTGAATIRGAGWNSNDVLIGNSDQTASSEFIFEAFDGNDTIKNFQFYEVTVSSTASSPDTEVVSANFTDERIEENDNKADLLHIVENVNSSRYISSIEINDDNVVLKMNRGNEDITIENARGKKIKYAISDVNDETVKPCIAKIDSEVIIYDGVTEFYKLTEYNATVSVAADFLDNAAEDTDGAWNKGFILLNGKVNGLGNQETFVGDIIGLDASAVTQSVSLAGNDLDNIIKAGNNGCNLWGNYGGDDTLIGGDGNDVFWYGTGNGYDVIEGYAEGDIISCYNMTENDVKSIAASGSNVVLTTDKEFTLTIKNCSTSAITFKDKNGKEISVPYPTE